MRDSLSLATDLDGYMQKDLLTHTANGGQSQVPVKRLGDIE
jgi:hypothetical protein